MDSTNAMHNIAKLDLDPIKVKLMHRESGEGWTPDHADAIELEYRRFLCMIALYPQENFAPLIDVDTFWHYHILDTRKYADDCQQTFGHFIHHHPYVGLGADDGAEHEACGSRMHALYQATFGEPCLAGAATTTQTAYCSLPGAATTRQLAYCSAVGTPQQAAYCSAPGEPLEAAYCSAPGKPQQAAYCSAPGTPRQTAYCSAPGMPLQTAYCSAPAKPWQTAYCSVTGQAGQTAYCSVTGKAGQTAYCSSPVATPVQRATWSAHCVDVRQSQWCAPANQRTLLAA